MRTGILRTRGAAAIGAWLLAAGLALLLWGTGALSALERSAGDARFAVRGDRTPDARLAVVQIDDTSLQDIGHFPFPRSRHATVIRNLRAAGAKVIAFDIVFAEQTTAAQDDALLEELHHAGNVVLAAAETTRDGRPNVVGGDPGAFRATAGDSNFPFDADGAIRRVAAEVGGLQSFAVAAARRYGHHVAFHGTAPIDFAGGDGSYPAIPYVDVLRDHFDHAKVRGRIVVVGASDPNLQDIHKVTTDRAMNGPELEANAISTVLRDEPLRRAPGWLTALLTVLLAAFAPAALTRRRPVFAVAAVLAATGVYAVLTQVLFQRSGLQVAFVAPVAGLVLGLPWAWLSRLAVAEDSLTRSAEEHARELAAARAYAAEAAEGARREVERNVHDGAQQKLVALALELARVRRRTEDAELADLLATSEQRLRDAVADLRSLAASSYPPVLTEGGLDAGLADLVDHLPATVRLTGGVGRRLPVADEAVGYFFASEGVANALKHAEAQTITITVAATDAELTVEVRDDGRGGASLDKGTGLSELRGRVESRGGDFALLAGKPTGTVLVMALPLSGDQSGGSPATPAARR